MTTLLTAQQLRHGAGRRLLLDGVDLTIAEGDRIGLVGHNGSGKSTLLALLDGHRAPEGGEVRHRNGLTIALIEQFLPARLAARTVLEAVAEKLPGHARGEDWRAGRMLARLGFRDAEIALRVTELSGGQQNRLMIARAVISEPDLLLLDEPTNHLDLYTLLRFEAFLRAFRGAFVLVSHDRAFLDAVTAETAFLRDARLHRFRAPYSEARRLLADADAAAEETRAAEERRIDALRSSARRLAVWGKEYDNEKFARRAKSMEKRAARLEDARTFVSDGSPLDLTLDLSAVRSKRILALERLTVTVGGGRRLFEVDELVIRPRERIALLGYNGAGKSTLIRRLVGVLRGAADRHVRVSPQVTLGYYDQELAETDTPEPMLAFVRSRVDAGEQRIRQSLIRAGFPFEDHGKAMAGLSGGERARVLFVVLSLARPNFLILDEPTNHLDLEGKEQLEAELGASAATVLITSHDRRFVDEVAERFLLIRDGRLEEIHSPELFYRDGAADDTPAGAFTPPPVHASQSDDDTLARIVELEALLDADRARKPKFQKPDRQVRWQRELADLYRRL